MQDRCSRREHGKTERPAAGVERDRPRAPACDERSRQSRSKAGHHGGHDKRRAAPALPAPLPTGETEHTGERGGIGAPGWIEVERAVDGGEERPRQIRAHGLETRRALLDRPGRLQQRAAPEGVASG